MLLSQWDWILKNEVLLSLLSKILGKNNMRCLPTITDLYAYAVDMKIEWNINLIQSETTHVFTISYLHWNYCTIDSNKKFLTPCKQRNDRIQVFKTPTQEVDQFYLLYLCLKRI